MPLADRGWGGHLAAAGIGACKKPGEGRQQLASASCFLCQASTLAKQPNDTRTCTPVIAACTGTHLPATRAAQSGGGGMPYLMRLHSGLQEAAGFEKRVLAAVPATHQAQTWAAG